MKPVKLFEQFLNESKYVGSLYHGGDVDFNKPMYFTNSPIIAQSYGKVTGPYQITFNKFVTLDFSTAEGWWLPEEATQRECKKFGMKPEDFNKYKQFPEVKSIKTDHFVRAAIDKGLDGIIFENIMDAGSHPVKGNKYIRTTNVVSLKPQKTVILFEQFLNESQKEEAAIQKVMALPKGSLFDDAKRIDGIFKLNNRPWSEIVQIWEQNESKAKPKTINPNEIQITQRNVQSNKVKEMIFRDTKVKTINVIQFPEGPVIYDGHHRLTKAWALGETKLKVNYIKL